MAIGVGRVGMYLTSCCAKFHQILLKIATVGAMTDRQRDTHIQTDSRQRSYNLSHAML